MGIGQRQSGPTAKEVWRRGTSLSDCPKEAQASVLEDLALRWVAFTCSLLALGSCKDDVYFIPGTGEVPDCNGTPVADLEGTVWTDRGLVTIRGPGCDVTPGVPFRPCGVYWAFSQDGNEVTIIVDGEYRIEGRLCGDELHLRGGWWLQLQLGFDVCQSRDELAGEVGIQAEGTYCESQVQRWRERWLYKVTAPSSTKSPYSQSTSRRATGHS